MHFRKMHFSNDWEPYLTLPPLEPWVKWTALRYLTSVHDPLEPGREATPQERAPEVRGTVLGSVNHLRLRKVSRLAVTNNR